MRRKTVGIIGNHMPTGPGSPGQRASDRYIRAVAGIAGAVPLIIPGMPETQDIGHLVEILDGIVLTGAGRGFCSGVDMGSLGAIQEAGEISAMREETDISRADPGDSAMGPDFESGFTYLMKMRKPVIAAVNGPCAGLGFSIAMFCDMRFASEDAVFTTAFAPRVLVTMERGSPNTPADQSAHSCASAVLGIHFASRINGNTRTPYLPCETVSSANTVTGSLT